MNEMEAQVLRAMLTKRGWADLGPIIDEDIIGNTNTKTIYAVIRKLHASTQEDLTPESVALDIAVTFDGDRQEELLDIMDEIHSTEEVPPDALQQAARNWATRELLAKASRYVATNLASADLDPSIAYSLCQRAMDLSESTGGEVVDLNETGLPGQTVDRPGLTSLGLSPQLDRCLGGGVASGELAVILAPPSRGKTSYLCSIGARAAEAGRNVLHITLEISTRRVARRYDAALTGLKPSELINAPKTVAAARKRVRDNGGSVHIKDWSYSEVSPADIRGLVKGMRAQGKPVDMVIVDYLELLVPEKVAGNNWARREQRHVFGALGKQMRASAVGLDLPIITAWQVNREGSDLHNVELRHVSESWDIIKHADQILSLNQTDAERNEYIMRIRILKQRDSTERPTIYLHSDLDRMRIRESAEGEPVEIQEITMEEDNAD